MTKRKVTIYDIAKMAGTSTATVSRVLSDSGYPVSDELRQKVLNIAREMHYSPNLVGRQLKTRLGKDIGIIVPSISNPYYPALVRGAEDVARRRGYTIFLCNSYRDGKIEEQYARILSQKQVRGLILSSISSQHQYLAELIEQGMNIVAFDQDVPLNCHKIGFDYKKAGALGAQHLVQLGHRRIAFLSAPMNRFSRRNIFQGFMAALKDYGVDVPDQYIIVSEYEEEMQEEVYEFNNGQQLARRLLQLSPLPTAAMVINDMTALGVIQALHEKGVKVPEDISIMGFDNIMISSMVTPPLTTINQPAYETGRLAAEVLIDSIEGAAERETINRILEPSLIIRESTAPPREHFDLRVNVNE